MWWVAGRDKFFGILQEKRACYTCPSIVNNTVFRLEVSEPNQAPHPGLWRRNDAAVVRDLRGADHRLRDIHHRSQEPPRRDRQDRWGRCIRPQLDVRRRDGSKTKTHSKAMGHTGLTGVGTVDRRGAEAGVLPMHGKKKPVVPTIPMSPPGTSRPRGKKLDRERTRLRATLEGHDSRTEPAAAP